MGARKLYSEGKEAPIRSVYTDGDTVLMVLQTPTDKGPSSKQLFIVVWVLSFVITLTVAAGLVNHILQSSPFDVLTDYSIQTVDEVTSDRLLITGVKCHDHDGPITIVGEFNWFRVIPPGYGTSPVSGVRHDVLPGCTTAQFENDIPQAVLDINEPGDVWFITGTEWPIDPDTGERGEPIVWVTENFELVE